LISIRFIVASSRFIPPEGRPRGTPGAFRLWIPQADWRCGASNRCASAADVLTARDRAVDFNFQRYDTTAYRGSALSLFLKAGDLEAGIVRTEASQALRCCSSLRAAFPAPVARGVVHLTAV
jgi:hypothetical protein